MTDSPRIVGFDLGQRHVGVAVWDDPDVAARPVATLEVTAATLIEKLAEMARRERAELVVVGLPLRLDGREGVASRQARKTAVALSKHTGLNVVLQDERMSTSQAHAHRKLAQHKGREGIDARAAAIILQTYVDTRRNDEWPQRDDDA